MEEAKETMSHPSQQRQVASIVDVCAERLHASGWSTGDTATAGRWFVCGSKGESTIEVFGESQAEAWQSAWERVEGFATMHPLEPEPRFVALVKFADGATRSVFEDDDGRQFVIVYDGERVYGIWTRPTDADELDAPVLVVNWPE